MQTISAIRGLTSGVFELAILNGDFFMKAKFLDQRQSAPYIRSYSLRWKGVPFLRPILAFFSSLRTFTHWIEAPILHKRKKDLAFPA